MNKKLDLKEIIKKRHSVRNFSSKKVSEEIIKEIIKYANMSPSAGNLVSREFFIIKDYKLKNGLSGAALNQNFISSAPFVIVVCADLKKICPHYGERGINLYCIQDASAAIEHILLMAVYHGLGACWVGAFDERRVSNILGLDMFLRPIALIPIGYEAETAVSDKTEVKN